MNDSAHLMILKRKLKKKNNTPLNRLYVLSYMYSLFTSETQNNVMRHKNANATNTTTQPKASYKSKVLFLYPKIE